MRPHSHPLIRTATTYDLLTRPRNPVEVAALIAGCTPCELAAQNSVMEAPVQGAMRRPWSGVLVVENEATGDGRMIETGSLRWEMMPLPLRWVDEDTGGHQNAVVIGTIETLERQDNGQIIGTGYVDLSGEDAEEAERRIENGTQAGVSVDLDDVSFEIRVAETLLQREEDLDEADESNEVPEGETDDEGRVTVIAINSGDEMFVTTGARIRAATVVTIPAFIGASIAFTGPAEEVPADVALAASMLALTAGGGIPVDPPAEWFADPMLTQPTRLTVTDDGRIYGHMAEWGICHRTHTQAGRCIQPPHSASGYGEAMTGTLRTAEGDLMRMGRLTMGTTHPDLSMSAEAAKAHYDNTGTCVADVRFGEDAHGIWVAGALRPGVTKAQMRALRNSPLSGDWRQYGSGLELVACLAVNTPGYPIQAPAGLVASGAMTALVAAGALPVDAPVDTLTDADFALIRRMLDREREQVTAEMQAEAAVMARSVEAASLAYQVGGQ